MPIGKSEQGMPKRLKSAETEQASTELSQLAGNPYLTAVVDLSALRHNLNVIRKALRSDQEIIPCLKANAYGHGLRAIARCLEEQGVRWLAVASPIEALSLRLSGITCRILVLPTIGHRPDKKLAQSKITISVRSYEELEAASRSVTEPLSIFLKVDIGLGRFGFATSDAPSIADRIALDFPLLKLEGIFTHLPFSTLDDVPWVVERVKEFDRCVSEIRQQRSSPLIVQAFSSAGITFGLVSKEANAVCPGQLLFGIESSSFSANAGTNLSAIQPVLKEVRTIVGALHRVPPGTRFGFGGAFTFPRETHLGVLPVGFSNSFLVTGKGQVASLLGKTAPILMVGLEHAVIDVTEIANVYDGCPVILLSGNSGVGPTLDHVAQLQRRSAVETLVSLNARATYEYVEL